MKKLSLFFFIFLLVISSMQGALWLEENFNYPDGDLEKTTASTDIELGKWIVSRKSADALGSSPTVANRNMSYPGYPGSAQGKVAVISDLMGATSADQRISVYYMDTLKSGRSLADSTRYIAFLFKPIKAQNSSGRDFFVIEGSITSSQVRGRLFLASSGTKVKIGIAKNSSTISEWGSDIEVGSTNLIVVKYEAVAGAENDVVKVFINPTAHTTEAANSFIKSTDKATDMWVSAVGIRQRGTGAEFGAMRVATTWEEAMGMASDALILESSTPREDDYYDPSSTSITLTFNKNITQGSGSISLTPIGGAAMEIPVANTVVTGKSVAIAISLVANKNYQLAIPAAAFTSGSTSSSAITINFTTTVVNPNLYVQECFDYPIGSVLEGQNGWQVSTAAADAAGKSPLVASGALSYSGYAPSDQGNVMALDSIAQEISGDLKRNTLFPFTDNSVAIDEAVYTAFMVNVAQSASTSGRDLFAYIKQGAAAGSTTTMRGRVSVAIEGDSKRFSIRKNSQTLDTWSAESPKSETALLVVKYVNRSTTSTGAADEFYLFVNPDLTKSEAENAAVKIDAVGNNVDGGADLRAVVFRQMKLNATVSGMRIAKTFADAALYKQGSAIENIGVAPLSIYASGSCLYYYGQQPGLLSIIDMMGRTHQTTLVSGNSVVEAPVASGIYIVKLQSEHGAIQSTKVLIK